MKDFLKSKFNFPKPTFMIVVLAVFTALAVVLNAVYIPLTQSLKLSLQYIPICLSSAIAGPIGGGLVGGVADVIGYFLHPDGVYQPFFTISGILEGIIMGLFLYNNKKRTVWNILFGRLTVNVFVYFVLNSIWLGMMYGTTYIIPMLPLRGLKDAIGIVFETVVLIALLPAFNNATKPFGINIGLTLNKQLKSKE